MFDTFAQTLTLHIIIKVLQSIPTITTQKLILRISHSLIFVHRLASGPLWLSVSVLNLWWIQFYLIPSGGARDHAENAEYN